MKNHLGIYSDWVEAAKRQADLYPLALPSEETRRQIRNVLGFSNTLPVAQQLRVEDTWKRDGLAGEALSWSVGYGPRTQAWFLKPDGIEEPLPGVLALHGHDGFKFFGKEKIPGCSFLRVWPQSPIGRTSPPAEHLHLSLFNTTETISFSRCKGCSLLISGLPLIMNGLANQTITSDGFMMGHTSSTERCKRMRLAGSHRALNSK
jgi:hypothetical protein